MKLPLSARLLISSAPLAVGALLPAALLYWVASHGLRLPPAESLATAGHYYSRPFDSLVEAALWHFPPFVLLALITFFISARATPRRLAAVLLAGFALILLPMVPRSIHTLKDTYRRNNSGEGSEFVHMGTAILSSVFLVAGLWFPVAALYLAPIPDKPKKASSPRCSG